MNNIAFYNGVKMTVEEASKRHDIHAKIKLGVALTEKERAFYLLFMASDQDAKEFLRKEKKNEF